MTPAVPTTFTATGQVVAAAALPTPASLTGLVVKDGSGSANTVTIHDGTSTAGPIVAAITVAAGAAGAWSCPTGVRVSTGVYASCTGTVVASVLIA